MMIDIFRQDARPVCLPALAERVRTLASSTCAACATGPRVLLNKQDIPAC